VIRRLLLISLLAPRLLVGQERGAVALGEAVAGAGVNTRVLMIGAHPDDEDTFLIAWLSRGRHVETAYLSLTRGDGGQNLIGNELGEALGAIRTEELLAARRIDGARQYFTRAYDFGFSKDTIDTYAHWPKDSILADVVRVVRAFRPHVIVAVFSGTPRDGHGHHQVSGLLAREAFDAASDTVRFPLTHAFDAPWTPLKFYRVARFDSSSATLGMDVGEYSPLLGRSYAEIAGESRSQHKSQGFGVLQRKGRIMDYVRREATRVNEVAGETARGDLFDGIDTTWGRFRGVPARDMDVAWARINDVPLSARSTAALDSLPGAFAAVRKAYDAFRPSAAVQPLARLLKLLTIACPIAHDGNCVTAARAHDNARLDFSASMATAIARTQTALRLAAGLEVEVVAARETYPVGQDFPAVTTLFNRGSDTVSVVTSSRIEGASVIETLQRLAPGQAWRDSATKSIGSISQPPWLEKPREGAMYSVQAPSNEVARALGGALVRIKSGAYSVTLPVTAAVQYRIADPVRGEIWRDVAAVPAIAVDLENRLQYMPANVAIERDVVVRLKSGDDKPRTVRVRLTLPPGLGADSVARSAELRGADAVATLTFHVGGRLPPGYFRLAVSAEADGRTYEQGYDVIDYPHITRQRLYYPSTIELSVVETRVPATLKVAYVPGVGDNVAPALAQLGVNTTVIPAAELARADLSSYHTVVVGPRAYDAHPELAAANPRLMDFARRGGTVVVQYGQYEMLAPGIMPYPITLARPADRVTHEEAAVTITAPDDRLLTWPNRITAADFGGWVQERALYMPRTFDARYRSLMAMNDPGESAQRGGVLVAPLGEGRYVYTTLALFRQLPAGVPGAARLFVNMLSAGLAPGVTP